MTDNKPVQRSISFSADAVINANASSVESGVSPGLKRRSIVGSHLEQKHEALNHLFGFIPTAVPVVHRPIEARSTTVQKLYEPPKKVLEDVKQESLISVSNVTWTLFFGWWLYVVYFLVTILLLITIIGYPYAKITWRLKDYYFWPFGKYIIRRKSVKVDDESPLINENSGSLVNQTPRKYIYPKEPFFGKIAWLLFGVPILSLAHLISFVFCWLPVILIPMAKVNMESIRLFFRNPLQLVITEEYPGARADVRLCTYSAMNIHYYKYSIGGVNVILVNLLPFVFVTLFCGYVLPVKYKPDPVYLFFTALLSVVPLAYYIGMAISSISAQTSLAVGALLNASFGSLSELILFGIAISTGSLDKLVQYSLTGSLLCTMLLTPGLAIMFGGLKYKEQQFNPASTGISSTLLIISIIGVFSPTVYYVCFGSYNLDCSNCTTIDGHMSCAGCKYTETEITTDPIYLHGAKPLMYTSCVIMPIAYIIGMVFTLKTHAHLFEDEISEAEAEDAPEWPLWKGILILVISTILDAMISEELISSVEPASRVLGLSQSFVGVFLLGGVANVSEVINAVNFALTDNIALSIELGMAATVQTALMQLPALILLAGVASMFIQGVGFTLIFPLLNVFAIIFAVITVNYVYISGKTNYFEGAALVLVYILFVVAFYFVPS